MPKIPRDISGRQLAELLKKFGYEITRQTGSHMRLTSSIKNEPHHITIPEHTPLKIGTLSQILKDIANYLKIGKDDFIEKLFEK
jgi:predicted RNA binding protein YcfA (HicA-like mRNA interferase family)